jgi:aldehyde:ferredoxin oxidoreductase
MDLYEKGIISDDYTGGPLRGGDVEAIRGLIEDIACRRGFGDILAEGVYGLDKMPPETEKYLCLIKNMPAGPPGWGAVRSFAMAMGVASLPGHVHRNRPGIDVLHLPADALEKLYGGPVSADPAAYEGKARMVWWHELLYTICDSLGCCRFQTVFNSPHAPQYAEYRELIQLSAGISLSLEELETIAERIYTTERLLLGAFGVGRRKDDALPERWVTEPGPGSIDAAKYEGFLDEYYPLHGWDMDDQPTPQTLERLEIKHSF